MNALALSKYYDHTSHDEVVLFQIANDMKLKGLSDSFIAAAIRTALDYEGVADLVKMWAEETDAQELVEIVADIQEMIEACSQHEKIEYPYVRFNDLETIAKHIREFKDALLERVDKEGGVTHLARLSGIPQPSLSRFFNSNAMPRRSMLLKIGRALRLDAVQLATEWAR